MDSIFQKVSGWKGAFTVIKQAEIEPRRYGKNGELLITIEEIDEKARVEHRNGHSSNDSMADSNPAMFTSTDEENQRRDKE